MYEAIYMEENNKPVAALCNKGFYTDAVSSASVKGMPGVRIVLETVPPHCTIVEQAEAGVRAALDDIINALVKPLTEEEKSPKPGEVDNPSRIVFKGNLEEVNQFFYKRGWTDGLPIIPPTEEKVAEMLTGTDLPADHVVVKIIPRLGKATVEKIAVNAVMAGALPTYMPILIAGVQASFGPNAQIGPWQLGSTLSPAPFLIINGPIRNDLHVNSSSGALAPGDIANAAIGRALQLVVKNIGGIRKGVEDMGVIGNPCKYTLTFAENEEESPWEPLHVEQGYRKEDSTVTVSSGNSFQIKGTHGTSAEGILTSMIQYVTGEMSTYLFLILTPEYAKILDSKGWTKKGIQDFVSSAVPGGSGSIPGSGGIQIVVAGGPGPCWIGLLKTFSGRRSTQKVELPANWDKLVKKYKDIVPTYALY